MSIFADIRKNFGDFRLDVQFSGGNEIISHGRGFAYPPET